MISFVFLYICLNTKYEFLFYILPFFFLAKSVYGSMKICTITCVMFVWPGSSSMPLPSCRWSPGSVAMVFRSSWRSPGSVTMVSRSSWWSSGSSTFSCFHCKWRS